MGTTITDINHSDLTIAGVTIIAGEIIIAGITGATEVITAIVGMGITTVTANLTVKLKQLF